MTGLMRFLLRWDECLRELFAGLGTFLPGLALRLILAYEYLESGWAKYHGTNWFGDIQAQFPFPFNVMPVDLSWALATWFELVGGVLLVLGLGTRYVAAALMVLTFVAAYAVHFPADWQTLPELWKGYAVSDQGFGNFKLPLLYFLMFLALLGHGPGRLSLDHLIARRNGLV
ncbi:MAG: doxX family protein [Moraxellaceae bacterium]|jgi:putative oxidoreductase|nr:doxX family protein [Moraxellaceae bacterium]